ncbi:MAG: VOC family protein [Miltoncostaeaceae bacterium]
MISLFPDICSDHVAESRDFYVRLFDFEILVDIGWYAQLRAPHDKNLQVAFVDRTSDTVPEPVRERPRGVLVTVEVKDVDAVHARAAGLGLEILLSLRSEDFGQRHFMTVDPNGLPVDVFTTIPPSPEFLREHGLADGAA